MILDNVKQQLIDMEARRLMLTARIADYEESLVNARKGMQEVQDEIALCELLLSVADGLSTGTQTVVESKPAPCASETYANPDILASRWRKGELPEAILNVLGREPERWFKPSEIMDEILKTHKRRTHSSSVGTVLKVLVDATEVMQNSGKYRMWIRSEGAQKLNRVILR